MVTQRTVRAAVSLHPVAATIAAAVALGVALTMVALRLPVGEEAGHAATHVATGVPAILVIVAARRLWPRPGDAPLARVARGLVVAGLAVFGAGVLVEGVGALGYEGYERTGALASLHDIGLLVGPLGILIAGAGAVLRLPAALGGWRRAVASPWVWAALALAVIGVGVLAFGVLNLG